MSTTTATPRNDLPRVITRHDIAVGQRIRVEHSHPTASFMVEGEVIELEYESFSGRTKVTFRNVPGRDRNTCSVFDGENIITLLSNPRKLLTNPLKDLYPTQQVMLECKDGKIFTGRVVSVSAWDGPVYAYVQEGNRTECIKLQDILKAWEI